jgi:antitoxin component of MazEF toxin-antitoxin module
MITAKLRRSGNSFIVTVPREEIDRMGLHEGQLVIVEVRPAEVRPMLAADLREAFEIEMEQGAEALKYLAQ